LKPATPPTGHPPSTEKATPLWANIFYDENTKEYYFPRAPGIWIRLTESSIRRHLKNQGLSSAANGGVSAVDIALCEIQIQNCVRYAGPLAGHKSGVLSTSGTQILVTESPKLIAPIAGEWPTLRGVIEGMFDYGRVAQSLFLHGWLHVALQALYAGNNQPGQALIIAGPKDCGKSFLQNIITTLLGGRSAKPYAYMTKATSFNEDLFSGEHQMIEDDSSSVDIRARRAFGNQIKSVTVNETQRMHGKGKTALILRPFWRLSGTLNNELENLLVLPPMDSSIEDKLILLSAKRRPFPTETPAARRAFYESICSELPAYVHFLLHTFVIPANLKCARFGITHYHHPDILASISALSPETRLWALIESEILGGSKKPWIGTAMQLESRLCHQASGVAREAQKLFTFANACGVYLGRLRASKPKNVTKKRGAKVRDWMLKP
jgi:hypothetical protein